MKHIKITPSKLCGKVNIPPSKSIAHRSIICASLSAGVSRLSNIDFSEDIKATIFAMESLGAKIERGSSELIIKGINSFCGIDNIKINAKESGSTLRFLVPIGMLFEGKKEFICDKSLQKRPMKPYYDIFDEKKIKYEYDKETFDLSIYDKLTPGDFYLKGDISSQFISGLLFALPLLKENSKIILKSKLESSSYIDLTLDVMKDFGINITHNNYREFFIMGNQSYKERSYTTEGDYSQGAFYICANYLGNNIDIKGLNPSSKQGDKVMLDMMKALKDRKENVFDVENCPDIVPILALACSIGNNKTKIVNAKRLRMKESDRLRATTVELNKLGANIKELEDGLYIKGVSSLKGGEVDSHNDHRIAMMLSIASSVCENEVIINDHLAIRKSYPNFYKDFLTLGGKIHEYDV